MRKAVIATAVVVVSLSLVSARWSWFGCTAPKKEYPVSTRIVAEKEVGEDNGAPMYRLKATTGEAIEVELEEWRRVEVGKEFKSQEWERVAVQQKISLSCADPVWKRKNGKD